MSRLNPIQTAKIRLVKIAKKKKNRNRNKKKTIAAVVVKRQRPIKTRKRRSQRRRRALVPLPNADVRPANVQPQPIAFASVADAPSMGTVPVYDPYQMGLSYALLLADPFHAPAGVHMMDRYDTFANESNFFTSSISLTVYNGSGAYDGSAAVMLRGDDYKTITVPNAVSSGHAVTWTGGSTYNTAPAAYTSNWSNRSMVHAALVRVNLFGLDHKIRAVVTRGPPDAYATQLAAAPAYTNTGLTSDMVSAQDGEEMDMGPGGVYAKSHRCRGDIEKSTWVAVGSDRSTNGDEVVYIRLFGLNSVDQVTLFYGGWGNYVGNTAISARSTGHLGAVQANSLAADLIATTADALSSGKHDTQVLEPGAESNPSWYSKPAQLLSRIFASEAAKDIGRRAAKGVIAALSTKSVIAGLEQAVLSTPLHMSDATNAFLNKPPPTQPNRNWSSSESKTSSSSPPTVVGFPENIDVKADLLKVLNSKDESDDEVKVESTNTRMRVNAKCVGLLTK